MCIYILNTGPSSLFFCKKNKNKNKIVVFYIFLKIFKYKCVNRRSNYHIIITTMTFSGNK